MYAAIGPATTVYSLLNRRGDHAQRALVGRCIFLEYFPQGGFDYILNSSPALLALPAQKVGAIVRYDKFETHGYGFWAK